MSDDIQFIKIKASTNETIDSNELGSLIGMKNFYMRIFGLRCLHTPINFFWNDCQQNFVITEDDDTLYLMFNEYSNDFKDTIFTNIIDSNHIKYFLNPSNFSYLKALLGG